MRVLTLTNLFPPQALGGYELSCADVMQRFARAGHDVHVLTTDTQLPSDQCVGAAAPADVAVERSLRWYWRDHAFLQPRLRQRLALELHNKNVVRRAIAAVRPDVVSVWGMGGMSLSLIETLNRSRVPVVYVVCDEWPVYGPRVDAWIARATDGKRRVVARAVGAAAGLSSAMPGPRGATFCWLSEFIRRRVLAATNWMPAHESVTYSGIDTTDFPLAEPRDRAWDWRLLAVGRVEPRKGFVRAVEALAKLPAQATLKIVGPDDGKHSGELRSLAEDLGVADRVSFDVVPRSQLRRVYDEADAVLFTSAWKEPLGLVPVEAMARAVPVVAVPTGGAREYLLDGTNCLAVEPTDAQALAAAVQRIAGDAALRAHLVAGGLHTASEMTADRLAEVLERAHQVTAS
jgi:glycogen synthase